MTTEPMSAGGDARRLLSDARGLAHRVRRDQRVTWVALLVLAGVTFVGIPIDWAGMEVHCSAMADGSTCQFDRTGVLFYWPPALLLAYAAIAFTYVRVTRSRGVGARVLPYVITGVALTVLFTAAWVAARLYFPDHPVTLPEWALVLDRLIAPWGTIGVALLVLARLERNLPLFVFTLAYLTVVLVPIDFGWHMNVSVRTEWVPQQVINGMVLLLGGIGFALARRRQR